MTDYSELISSFLKFNIKTQTNNNNLNDGVVFDIFALWIWHFLDKKNKTAIVILKHKRDDYVSFFNTNHMLSFVWKKYEIHKINEWHHLFQFYRKSICHLMYHLVVSKISRKEHNWWIDNMIEYICVHLYLWVHQVTHHFVILYNMY